MDQKITKYGKKVLGHDNFKKDELEELLTAIIGGTSDSGTSFKNIEARGYAESPFPAESTKIAVDRRDMNRQRITVRIQLVDCIEWWTIDIPLRQGMDQKILHKEIRKSSIAVCAVESKKNLLLSEKEEFAAPIQKVSDTGSECPAMPQPKEKRTRRNASSLIPDELILKILLSWVEFSKGTETIDQRDFWGIALSLGVAKKDTQTVLAILKRKGVIEEIPIKYKPQVKIAQLGRELLNKQRQQSEEEKLEAEKSEHLQKARTFPMRALSPLKKVRDLQSVSAQLTETTATEEALIQKIKELQNELAEQEEALVRIRARKNNHYGELVRIISLTDPKRIAELIEIAKKSVRQKVEPQN
jgi:hypothetical protein